jgi:hypothetical protein
MGINGQDQLIADGDEPQTTRAETPSERGSTPTDFLPQALGPMVQKLNEECTGAVIAGIQ